MRPDDADRAMQVAQEPVEARRDEARSHPVNRPMRNTMANYLGQGISMGVWFFLTPFMLHRLDQSDYGMWVLASTFVLYGGLLELGVGGAVTKYVAEYRGRGELARARPLIATALRVYAAMAVIALLVGAVFAWFAPLVLNVPPDDASTMRWLVLVSALGLAVQLPATCTHAVLKGLQRYDTINMIGVGAALVFAATTVVVLLLGGGIVAIAATTIPLTVLWQIPAVLTLRRTAPELSYGWSGADRSLVTTIGSFSAWLLVTNASGLVKKKTDELVIAAALPIADVTPYSVARRASDLPGMAVYQYLRLLLPMAAHVHHSEDERALRQLLVTSTRISIAIFTPLALGMGLLSQPFLVAWVGPVGEGTASITVILLLAGLAEYAFSPAAAVLQASGRHKPIAVFSAGGAVLNLLLSVVLVRSIGVKGVALGTLIATVIELLVVMPYSMRTSHVTLREAWSDVVAPTALAAIPATGVILLLRAAIVPTSLLAIGAIMLTGTVVYAACFLIVPGARLERRAVWAWTSSRFHR